MISRIVLVALCVALAFAQSPQTGQLTWTPLVDGALTTGTLVPTTTANNYHVNLYSFYVPYNASSVNLTMTNTDSSSCTYVHLFFRIGGLPCSYHDYSSSSYLCANTADPGNGVSGTTGDVYVPGDYSDLFEYAVGQNWYIGIGRYGSYNTATCSYNLFAATNSSCGAGSVGIAYDFTSSTYSACAPLAMVTSLPSTSTITAGANYQQVWMMNVPQGTGHIYVMLNATSTGGYLYGKSYAAPSYYNYNCYQSSYTTDPSGNYIYSMFCYTPRAGDFYIALEDDSAFNATITFNMLVCGAGMGGYNCTYPAQAYNATSAYTLTIPYVSTGVLSYSIAYLYMDIPANYTGPDFTVAATTTGSGYMYLRREGWTEDSSTYGYEGSFEYDSYPAFFGINNFEFAVPGRIVMGFDCTASAGCTVNVAANVSSVMTGISSASSVSGSGTTTQGVSGQGTTTQGMSGQVTTQGMSGMVTTYAVSTGIASGEVTTGQRDSSAGIIVPSLLFAGLVALLF